MSAPSERDPINALSKVLGAMGVESRAQTVKLARNEHNRINLLIVHALVALLVAPLFVATQGAFVGTTWNVIRQVPGFPITFISPLWLGGIILLPATYARRVAWELVGLALIWLWYTAMGIGFGFPVVTWLVHAAQPYATGSPLPAGKPSLYAPMVYLHLAAIMQVHIVTLWRMRKERNSDAARKLTP